MNMRNDHSFTHPTAIIIQPLPSQLDLKSNKFIFRLGWISFILGFCAFLIHYISLDRLENFSPINAGIISGIFLMTAGLVSVAAGYKEKSYRCFIHAHIWSFITNIILAPGLIAVSITALILDSNDISPICQSILSFSRNFSFGNDLKVYSSNLPCLEAKKLFNLTQILNIIQLIIGVLCFVVHMILISLQRKVIKQIKNETNVDNNKIIVYAEPNNVNTRHTTYHADNPPKYEDLSPTQILCD